jgi:hypothetical protein
VTLPTDCIDAIATARDRSSGPLVVPWPMPGNLSSFLSFATFAEWREFVLRFNLHPAIPLIVSAKFERAQKLYLLTWVDFDLIKAGELVALIALDLALRDRYVGKETERRRKFVAEKAEKEKREVTSGSL